MQACVCITLAGYLDFHDQHSADLSSKDAKEALELAGSVVALKGIFVPDSLEKAVGAEIDPNSKPPF